MFNEGISITLTICGIITTVGGAVIYIKKLTKPILEYKRRIEAVESKYITLEGELEMLKGVGGIQEIQQSNAKILQTLFIMLNYMVNDTNKDKKELEKQIAELQNFLLQRV